MKDKAESEGGALPLTPAMHWHGRSVARRAAADLRGVADTLVKWAVSAGGDTPMAIVARTCRELAEVYDGVAEGKRGLPDA